MKINPLYPRNLTEYFGKKVTGDCCGHKETLADTKDCLSDTTKLISKVIGVKFRK